MWPAKPIAGELELHEVVSVDKGNLLNFIGGGVPLRLRLKNGHDKLLWDDEGRLNEWVESITKALASHDR